MLPIFSRKRRRVATQCIVSEKATCDNDHVAKTAPAWSLDVLDRNPYQSHVEYQDTHIVECCKKMHALDMFSPKGMSFTFLNYTTCSSSNSCIVVVHTC